MRIVALCMAMLLFSPAGVAAELPNPDAAVALVDRIMAKVAAGDLRGGMEIAKPYTIVPVAEFDAAIGQAEMQTPVFLSRFGKSIGHELIRNDAVGQSLIQIVELQKFLKTVLQAANVPRATDLPPIAADPSNPTAACGPETKN